MRTTLCTAVLVLSIAVVSADVAVDQFVVPIKQDKTWQCWAAGTAMINNWARDRDHLPRLSARDTVSLAGQIFTALFDAGDTTGINPDQELQLYQKLGFLVKRQQSLTVDAWADLLRTHGPLGVTINRDPKNKWAFHEIVLTTMKGDGSAKGTKVSYIDPGKGLLYTVSFAEFVKLYEAASGYAIQIVYIA